MPVGKSSCSTLWSAFLLLMATFLLSNQVSEISIPKVIEVQSVPTRGGFCLELYLSFVQARAALTIAPPPANATPSISGRSLGTVGLRLSLSDGQEVGHSIFTVSTGTSGLSAHLPVEISLSLDGSHAEQEI